MEFWLFLLVLLIAIAIFSAIVIVVFRFGLVIFNLGRKTARSNPWRIQVERRLPEDP